MKIKTIIFIFLTSIVNCFSQSAPSKKIDSILTLLNKQNQFNGNVLILNEGKQILKKSYGFADRETKEKLNENTIFELASLSKQFTATGIILLERQNKLSLNNNLTKFFPELKVGKEITILNLLNHTSGLQEYFGLGMKNWDKKEIFTNKKIIDILSQKIDSLKFKPNDRFEYCNTNYLLLASIIEKVSKQKYADFMKANVFAPLNMNNTFIYRRHFKPKKVKNYAEGYVLDNNEIKLPKSSPNYNYAYALDGILGDGMINSTINDLKKWDNSLRNYSLLNKSEIERINKSSIFNDKTENNYSFGWRVKNRTMSHSGSWPGYVTYISRDIDKENLIIILQNFEEVKLPIKTIKEILNNKPISTKYKKEIKVSENILKKYTGEYIDLEDNSVTKLTLGKNSLIYNSKSNPWNMGFFPASKTTFFSKSSRMNIGFEFKMVENKIHLIFKQNNKKIGESIKK